TGQIAGNVDCSHASIVKRGVKNSAVLVDGEIVGTRAIEVEECNFPRCSQVAGIDYVNVAAGRRSDTARSFLTDEHVALLRGHRVVKPPNVVGLTADGGQPAELHRIRNCADSRPADVPDRYAQVPKCGNHD